MGHEVILLLESLPGHPPTRPIADVWNIKHITIPGHPPTRHIANVLNIKHISNHWLDLTHNLNISYGDQTKVYKGIKWRRPESEDYLKIRDVHYKLWGKSQQPLWFYSNSKLKLRWPHHTLQILKLKTTSYERRHQNIKSGICQQPLSESYSNFKLKLKRPNNIYANPLYEDNLQWKKTSKY